MFVSRLPHRLLAVLGLVAIPWLLWHGGWDVYDERVALDDESVAEGRGLLDEVRSEHARISALMQVVSSYEERLRRVEESVAEPYEGDRRHPV